MSAGEFTPAPQPKVGFADGAAIRGGVWKRSDAVDRSDFATRLFAEVSNHITAGCLDRPLAALMQQKLR